MNTTTATKKELIAALVLGGTEFTPRRLRDFKRDELAAMVEQAEAEARAAAEGTDSVLPEGLHFDMLYTVAEVAELVGLTKFAVRRWVRLGYLANVPSPQATREGQFHIAGDDLADFLIKRSAA